MTKKQIAALWRIIKREQSMYDTAALNANKFRSNHKTIAPKQAGVHPSLEKYIVTDRCVAVIFSKKPPELPGAERNNGLYEQIQCDISAHRHILALTVTAAHISEWKRLSKPWRAGNPYRISAPPAQVAAQSPDDRTVVGLYNPCYLIDAVEAIGPGAMIYIGRSVYDSGVCLNTLLIYPQNWMENPDHEIAYVLPRRY